MSETIVTTPTVTAEPATAPRGRVASARTVAIRTMLESNPELTYSQALPTLQAQGHEVDQNTYNVIKCAWKRARRPDKAEKPRKERKARKVGNLPEVTVEEAVAFVTQAGGLAKAETLVLRELALVRAFKRLLKQAQKLAA